MAAHYRQVDGLRFYASLCVVLVHYFPGEIFPWAFVFGQLGTPLFFVLAGYLSTLLLLKNFDRAEAAGVPRSDVLGRYYIRRLARLCPLMSVAVLLLCMADVQGVRETAGWHLLFATNLYQMSGGQAAPYTFHLWYIGVQEQALVILALLMLWVPRQAISKLLIGGIVVALITRFACLFVIEGGLLFMGKLPTGWMDLICAGGLAAWYSIDRPPVRPWQRVAWPLAVGVSVAAILISRATRWAGQTSDIEWLLLPTLLAPAYVWLVLRASRGFGKPMSLILGNRVVVYLGTIGYGLYVYHFIVARVFGNLLARTGYPLGHVTENAFGWTGSVPSIERGSWFTIALWLVTTVALASLSYQLIEKPIASIKKRLPYVPDKPADPTLDGASGSTVARVR